MSELTPRQIVAELDRHIIGQDAAKRSVAIALRNRWRWKQLPDDLRRDVTPKNILMIGPTGVGKTEITRRLAQLTGAPFVKVEASKYTEVGYYGRDVESMIRDLVDAAIHMVREQKQAEVQEEAAAKAEERLLDMLVPPTDWTPVEDPEEETRAIERHERTREKFRKMLANGELEDSVVDVHVEQRQSPVQVFSTMGLEQVDLDVQNMLERFMPRQGSDRELPVSEARKVLIEQEVEGLLDDDAVSEEAVRLATDNGIVFLDEVDKICGPEESGKGGADVSRQGVQRDLLPIIEGTTVQTRNGSINTEHILFIAAGAFHRSRPSDLMPELQGRFPIRVELDDLTQDDFVRILTEPSSSLTRQYEALLAADGVKLKFTKGGVAEIANIAYQVNQSTQNIGARRLHTILERLLEAASFEAPEDGQGTLKIDETYVQAALEEVSRDEDLSRFIL
ncbi:MAG TPA: HslU--HslV peptidase ATPase subunit [Planctomycetaceae bacterium]|nr:HslU--HslV peptidase ATPase subunit [Planctomycetaceae bacterium]|tara:strand:+ start:3707 stop:5059 length:1353 start_codon:yes stop_codon:yes gene_type:complete